ncbi:MAG TPA: hypothetical protein VIL07_00045, partial [Symbiobacteriaceae bacterium]
NSVISVGYYYNVVRAMFLEEPGHVSLHTSRGSMAAVVISCVGVLVAGVLSSPLLAYTEAAAYLLR